MLDFKKKDMYKKKEKKKKDFMFCQQIMNKQTNLF